MSAKRKAIAQRLSTGFLAFLAAGTLVQTSACHRGYYRRQADAEATKLISEKVSDPQWDLPDRTIEIDPRSRMAHPFSADQPPMPPDDPASHEFMRRVDNKPGYPHWGANGELDQVENPEWMSFVPLNDKGELVLDINRAVQVAYLHSPTYQNQRENLYLSALDVSLERFAFDAQLFASYNSFLTADGRIRGGGNSRTSLEATTGNNGVSLRKLGITGSTLVVGMANTMLWQFAGPTTNATNSLVDVSFIQPLLRGGGRERFLESLTFAERTLLANVRQMERFRRGFYLSIVTGRNPGLGPNLGGNFLGTPGDQGAGVGGVLGLLEDRQNISIQEYNVTQLRNVLERFRFLQQAQRINALQVTLVETRLYSAQQQLFRSTINYEASLDNFKINLGLPPEMKIVVEDPILEQFQLIDNNAVRLQDKLTRLREAISLPIEDLNNIIYSRALNADGQPVGERDEPVAFSWGDDVTERLEKLPDIVAEIETLRQSVLVGQLQAVRQDIERLRATRESRIKNLSKLKDLDLGFGLLDEPDNAVLAEELISEQAVTNPDKLLSDVDLVVSQLEGSPALELRTALENIRKLQQSHDNSPETQSLLVEGVLEVLPQALADVTSYSLELLLIQVKARVELVELAEVRLEPDVALRIAQHFRRDWMNARASLVDAWRLIEFQADQLESTFDLVFEGDVGTVGDNPTNFRTATGRARAGFRFDSPITRLQERNNYRTALIRYQQARRQYYQFRDGISRNLRQILRLIELNKVLFELNRLQIKVNAVNVEQSNFEVSRPAAPGARTTNPTIARDLTDAINQLQQAQSAFLSTWVDYEVLRRGLDFDLGTMKLDENSLWIDPGPINQQYIERLIEEDQRLLEELGGLDWFESREEFMESTGLDLKAMGGPGLPIPGEVETASGPSSGAAPEDEELNKLKQQLRSELQRLAKLESQRPATGATGATGAAAPATERAPLGQSRSTPGGSPPNFSVGGAMPQTPVRPVTTGGGGLPMPAMAVPPTEKTPSSTPPRSTPVDVTAAFPALPKPTGQLPSPQTLPPLTGLPALEDDRDPTATPRRFRPVVPQ